MRTFQPSGGLLPLGPYEPTEIGAHDRGDVAEGQLSLDDLLREIHAQHALRPKYKLAAPGQRILHRVLTALLEVHTGRRAVAQLDSWLTPQLQRLFRASPRAIDTRYILRNIHVCRPAEDALEICGTTFLSGRARALIARFEHNDTGWRCTLFTVLGT